MDDFFDNLDKSLQAARDAEMQQQNQTDNNHIEESVARNIAMQAANEVYAPPTELLSDKYRDYNVYAGAAFTKQDLDRQRAKNQRWYEQAARMLGQGIVNEVGLGTIRGILDIADFIGQEISGNYDYTNPISQLIEETQDKIKDEWAIYQQQPDKSFDFSDSGWWFNNLVSVWSSVGLMIPATGYAKLLSGVSKALSFDTKLYKAIKSVTSAKKAAGATHAIGEGTYIATQALASRIGENYQEARQTYNENYNTLKERWANMSDEEKNKFKIRNGFVGLSDEEIFKEAAGQTAHDVFVKDMALFTFDLIQFASINKMIKGTNFGARGLDKYAQNIKGLEQLTGVTSEQLEKTGTSKIFRNKVKALVNHPFNAIEISQISEGVEEGWQGIAQAQATDKLERMLNPNFTERNMTDFLQSGEIWEQAFWGWLGGLAFSGAASAYHNVEQKVKVNNAKKTHSAEELEKMRLVEEEQISDDIKKRVELANRLSASLAAIEHGKKPYIARTTITGEIMIDNIIDENQMSKIAEEDKAIIRQKLINDCARQLAINAVNNGTGDLMQEWLDNDIFRQSIINATKDAVSYNQLKDKFNDALTRYNQNLYLIYYNTKLKEMRDYNKYAPRIVAAQMLKNEDRLNELQDEINRIDEVLKIDKNDYINDQWYQYHLESYINDKISELNQHKEDIEQLYNNHQIGKTSRDLKIKEVDKRINNMLKYLNGINNFETALEYDVDMSVFDKFNKWMSERHFNVNKTDLENLVTSKQLLQNKIEAATQIAYEEADQIITQEDFDNAMLDIENGIEVDGKFRLQQSIDKLIEHIKTAENPEEAFNDIMEENDNINEDLKNAAAIVKLGERNYEAYYALLSKARDEAIIKKQSTIPKVPTNNTPTSEPAAKTEPETTTETTSTPAPQSASKPVAEPKTKEEDEEAPLDIVPEEDKPDNVPLEFNVEEDIPTNLPDVDITTNLENVLIGQIMYVYNRFISQNRGALPKLKEYFTGDRNDECKRVYRALIREINESIEGYVVDKKKRNAYIGYTLYSLNKKGRFKGLEDETYQSGLEQAALELINKSNIKNATSRMIIVHDNDDVDKLFIEYLKEIDAEITGENDKKQYINVDEFFYYLYKKYGIDYANVIFTYIKNDIRTNNSNKFTFINKNNLNAFYSDNSAYFTKLYNDNNTSSEEYQHVSAPTNVIKSIEALNKLREEKKLEELGILIGEFNGRIAVFKEKGLDEKDATILTNYVNASLRARNGSPIYYKLNRNKEGIPYSISIHCPEKADGQLNASNEIGFLATVQINATHDGYAQYLTQNKNRLYFDVALNNGQYVSSLDELFENIFNDTDNPLYKELLDAMHNGETKVNDDLAKAIVELFKNSKFKSSISRKQNIPDKEFAQDIYNQILDIVTFINRFPLYIGDGHLNSYQQYKQRIYSNYEETYRIQQLFYDENGKFDEKVKPTSQYRNDSNNLIVDTNKEYTANKQTLKFNPNNSDFSLVYFNNQMQIIVDKDKSNPLVNRNIGNKRAINRIYGMGFRIFQHPINPGIVHVVGTNPIKHNTYLYTAVKREITDILNNTRDESFDTRVQRLENILGRGGLFKNVITGYSQNGKNKGSYYIAKRKKEDEKEYDFLVTLKANNNKIKNADKTAERIVNELLHNECEECITGEPREGKESNLYIQNNSKNQFTINIGGQEFTYNGYTDYVLENEAFRVRESINSNNSVEDILASANDNYFRYAQNVSPVEGSIEAQIDTLDNLIKQATKNNPVKTVDLFRAFNFTDDQIKLYFGVDTDVQLVSDNVYYDDSIDYDENNPDKVVPLAYEEHNEDNPDNSKIVFTKAGLNVITNNDNGFNGKDDFIRLLIHENIHRHYNNLSDTQKIIIEQQLQKIYKRIDEVIDEDLNNENLSDKDKNLVRQINNLFNSFKKDGKYDTNEFLAEVLSQKVVIEYLDNKQFDTKVKENVEGEIQEKSIWREIVDAIYKILFGKDLRISNKNSIFAQLYKSLVFDNKNNTIAKHRSNQTVKENKEAKENNTKKRGRKKKVDDTQQTLNFDESQTTEETQVPVNEPVSEEQEVNDILNNEEFENIDFATSKRIVSTDELRLNANTDVYTHTVNGVGIVNNMNSFIAAFGNEQQLKIAKMIENGDILFVCR